MSRLKGGFCSVIPKRTIVNKSTGKRALVSYCHDPNRRVSRRSFKATIYSLCKRGKAEGETETKGYDREEEMEKMSLFEERASKFHSIPLPKTIISHDPSHSFLPPTILHPENCNDQLSHWECVSSFLANEMIKLNGCVASQSASFSLSPKYNKTWWNLLSCASFHFHFETFFAEERWRGRAMKRSVCRLPTCKCWWDLVVENFQHWSKWRGGRNKEKNILQQYKSWYPLLWWVK